MCSYIYTGVFSNNNEVNLLDIFVAADEIGLLEISQQKYDTNISSDGECA
ncbi:45338_t:CDS:2 [Gigaspora margarita]|uniref:45338_t:CDS:1 n=1 Tax=Gigaspora margarita TaxID=4874 RepID=A0ABM8W1G7_GIGMA|nr:45338_t:CDS:2 [Gigaspora margarita]